MKKIHVVREKGFEDRHLYSLYDTAVAAGVDVCLLADLLVALEVPARGRWAGPLYWEALMRWAEETGGSGQERRQRIWEGFNKAFGGRLPEGVDVERLMQVKALRPAEAVVWTALEGETSV